MVMKPQFYEKRIANRVEERKKLGLDPALPTGIVLFGGHGSSGMLDIVRRLDAGKRDLQMILICGKNRKLLEAVKGYKARFPIFAEGFTREVDYYMSLADFFIGKPGPASISEALQLNLPVIVECNGRTLPQERYNAQWITENRVGIVLKGFRQIAAGVNELLDPSTFTELKKNAGGYSNRALLEIPGFLEEIMERHGSRPAGLVSPVLAKRTHERAAWASMMTRSELALA